MNFEDFFFAATGQVPFAWQRRLALEVTQGDATRVAWPDVCALPTATGKTSLILIAIYALAIHPKAHRRIAYVMDRRIVVDETYKAAEDLRDRLGDPEAYPALVPFAALLRERLDLDERTPLLETHLLRGGLGEPLARLESPLTPTILVGTVDQLGSRLLFRGYGVSDGMRSISAGLLSHDTLWILDEAHLSRAFADTLKTVAESVATSSVPAVRPLHLIEVSATPRPSASVVFKLGIQDDAIRPRLDASKMVTIVDGNGKTADQIVRLVRAALTRKKRRIGVIVNRVLLARDIFAKLEKPLATANAERLLLIGPIRGTDRDRLYARPSVQALSAKATDPYERPIVAICTQTVEVGADLDFDSLIVQSAPLDVLRQRFGRLDRIGRRPGADGSIVFDIDDDATDFIYGEAIGKTVHWLCSLAPKNVIDFGVNAFDRYLAQLAPSDIEAFCAPSIPGEPLDARHIRNLSRTNSAFADSPDVAIFLHGETRGGDIRLVWRDDFDPLSIEACDQQLSAAPPCSRESLTLSLSAARSFLLKKPRKADDSDAGELDDDSEPTTLAIRPAVRWKSNLESIEPVTSSRDLRPGDTLVIPSSYGGLDEFGWAPSESKAVADVSVEAFVKPVRALDNLDDARALRFRVAVGEETNSTLESHVEDELRNAALSGERSVPSEIARVLSMKSRAYTLTKVASHVWVTWRKSVADDGTDSNPNASSFSREVSLVAHLRHVEARARSMALGCGLSHEVADRLARAGVLHDLGKADERFQIMLRGGDLLDAITKEPLGKGLARYKGRKPNLPIADTWPRRMRHETLSVAMTSPDDDRLVRHLIGTHHGYGRPSFPVVADPSPRLVRMSLDDEEFSAMSDAGCLASVWEEQFEALSAMYGAWGLAYLEAILRLADHRCSEDEMNGEADVA